MPSRRFSGVIRLQENRAKLETQKGLYTLVPFPKDLSLPAKTMEEAGKNLFSHLIGQEVVVEGTLIADVVYNAHLAESRFAVEDIQLAPGSKDRLAGEIRQYFRKDSSEIAVKLNAAGIRTISALYHRIKDSYEEESAVFSKYLKVPEERIKEFLSALELDAKNRALVSNSPRFPVKRGVNLDLLAKRRGVPVAKKAPTLPPKLPVAAITPELPTKVDLTVHVTPIKNQGMRGTCVAHTVAACLETELIRKGKAPAKLDLSEQYIYWACKNIDGAPDDEGTFIEYAAEVLLNGVAKEQLAGGSCTEKEWPYNPLPNPSNESQGPLSVNARQMFKNTKQHRILKYSRLKQNSIKALKKALASGHCVGLSVYTYHFWTDDFAWREGIISLPLAIEPDGAHAICLVGYRDDDETHGEGYFIFKNSWDKMWGYGRPDPGFGSLPYRYVLKEAIEAYTIDA